MLGKMFSIDQKCWVANLSLKRRPASLQIPLCLSLHIAENQAAGGDAHGGARWQETSHRVDTELASEFAARPVYHAINLLSSHPNSIICVEISASE